jgi:hypothetical protein
MLLPSLSVSSRPAGAHVADRQDPVLTLWGVADQSKPMPGRARARLSVWAYRSSSSYAAAIVATGTLSPWARRTIAFQLGLRAPRSMSEM